MTCHANGKTYNPSPLWLEQATVDGFLDVKSEYAVNPDFHDPEWIDKVDDWDQFWHNQEWELEIADLDDDDAIAGSEESLRRAQKLVEAFSEMDRRTDIVNWMGPEHTEEAFEDDKWVNPPLPPVKWDPNPPMSEWELRVMAEKRRQQEWLDAEWRRQQAQIGKFTYEHMDQYRDKRHRVSRLCVPCAPRCSRRIQWTASPTVCCLSVDVS